MKKISTSILLAALIVGLNGSGLLAIGQTFAMYSDTENSSDNGFTAGALDFSLDADDWSPVDKAGALAPGDTITRHMSVLASTSIPFQYNIKTIKTSGDDAFCDALHLVATRESTSLYDGSLMGFDLTPPVEITGDGQDDWTFDVDLPSGAGAFNGKSCEFRFDVDGWQIGFVDGLTGFSDHEELENILESAVEEDSVQNISVIEDSDVDEEHPTANNGNSHDVKVKSKSVGKNKRAFVRFDFHFPTDTTIHSAALKLFLDDAASDSRTYATARALSSWTESGITWSNQPATSSPSTATVTTGTTHDVWLSWDVKDDVSGFVAETFSNYGWSIFDVAESAATAREGKLTASEDGDEGKRPVLEVAFSAPAAPTTHMVVNEVYYDVGSGKGSEGTNEWVELYNPTVSAIDIKNWKICDALSCDTLATTSPSILVPSHGFAVITPNASTWANWTLPAGTVQIVIGELIGNGLANGGDTVILKDASNVEIDAMSYGSDTSKLSPSVPLSGAGKSLARIIKGYDADVATDWIINATANPGTNPSDSGVEIIRFTDSGIEVADYAVGLEPLSTENSGITTDPSTTGADTLVTTDTTLIGGTPALIDGSGAVITNNPVVDPDPSSPTPSPSPESPDLNPSPDPSLSLSPDPSPSPDSNPLSSLAPSPSSSPTPSPDPSPSPSPETIPITDTTPSPTSSDIPSAVIPETTPTPSPAPTDEPTPPPAESPAPAPSDTPTSSPEPTPDTSPAQP